ncbi:DUF4214 domain-containing protein [Vogesella fluminis]|uniref:DUF4214 domain-containing protein n=1 Tax=Vogesella fluminis TaxID=1069161 RepID=A0ABQ3HCQ4_9NEIS|nr:DUF4214 domain-containing protein [Vogesella fluminis]GHD78484.1 hypothetical protein GCM10011419_20600 [Vogesella fluminis]
MAVQFLTQAQVDSIHRLYVSNFNRNADAEGADFWGKVYLAGLNAGKTDAAIQQELATEFSKTAEFTTTYPATMSAENFVKAIYQNVLNRPGDAGGVAYWTAQLETGTLQKSTFILNVLNAVVGTGSGVDYDYLAARVAASESNANIQGFTLTSGNDTATANVFNADQVYTPGGNDRINTLQDDDVLTGTGDNPTLNFTFGDDNDAGGTLVTPELHGIETINVKFVADAASTLDLQDATGVETVNVTRVQTGLTVQNMEAAVVNLSVANSAEFNDVELSYRNGELAGTQSVTVELDNALIDDFDIGATAIESQQVETVTLNVVSDTLINDLDLRQDGLAATGQSLVINATGALVIANDTDGDGNYIEEANGLEEVNGLDNITITGAGNVTLGDVGNMTGFDLVGGTATGVISANISNPASDDTSTVTTGSGNDVLQSDEAYKGDITTGAGDDTLTVTGSLLSDEDLGEADEGANVDLGAGNDTATIVGVVDENSSLAAGEGNDTITLGSRGADTSIAAGNFAGLVAGGITAGTTAAEDADGAVDLGAGDDSLTIISGTINGDVAGGAGADSLTLEAVDNVTVAEETATATGNATVTGVETLNLTAAFAYADAAGQVAAETDDDDDTANFEVDLGAFDADLATINIANQDRATFAANGLDAEDGDAIAVALTDYNNETINITSVETDRNAAVDENGNAIGTALETDELGTAFDADVTLTLTHAAAADSTAVSINLTGDEDFDVTLVDGNVATSDIDTLNMVVTGAGDHGIELSDDFDTALNITGAGTGELTLISVVADTIDTDAHVGNVFVEVADSAIKTISTGAGNDVLNLLADTITTDDALNLGEGTDRIIVDTTLGDVATGDDEVFEGFVSIEELELATNTNVMLNDDGFATGVARIIAQGTSTIRTGTDFERALTVDMDAVTATTVTIDNDGDNDFTVNASLEDETTGGAAALDRTLVFTDAGTNNDVVVNVAITGGVATEIDATAVGGSANSEMSITVAAGSIDQIVLADNHDQDDDGTLDADEAVIAAGRDNSAVTVTVSDAWSNSALTIDASAITDDDATRTDGTRSGTTGGVTINAVAELDAALTILGSANDDAITGGDEADTLTGNGGNDTFVYSFANADDSTSQSADTITDFNAGDVITVAVTLAAGGDQFLSTFATVASLAAGDNSLDGAPADLRFGDSFFSTDTNQFVIDVDGNGDVQDGVDLVINVAGFTASQVQYTITGAAGANDITTGAGNDTINDDAADNDDTFTGGAGADTIASGNVADSDIFVFNAGDSGLTVATSDIYTGTWAAATDTIDMAVAGGAGNYAEADVGAAADLAAVLALANTALDGTVKYYVGFNADNVAADIGLLFIDNDMDGSADEMIRLVGVDTAGEFDFDAIV